MKALKNICAISLLLGATAFTSCTDLTEEIHSSVIAENYYNNAGEVMAAMMRPWGHFCGTMQVAQSPWSCNELDSLTPPSMDSYGWSSSGCLEKII